MSRSLLIIFFSFSLVSFVYSQQSSFEKAPSVLKISGLPQLDMDILVRDSVSYLPVRVVFDYIGIRTEIDSVRRLITGFFKSPDSTYKIDLYNRIATYNKKSFSVTERDAIIERGIFYLRTGFIGDFFGIDIIYDPRTLTVMAGPARTFPAVKFQTIRRRIQARNNKGSMVIPDDEYFIDRNPWTTGAGQLSWYTFSSYSEKRKYMNYSLFLNSKVLGGDLDMSLRGTVRSRFTRDPIFRWSYRIPFPNNTTLTQINIGRIVSNGLIPLDALGVEFTNRPLASRIVFAREKFSDKINPSTIVEYDGGSRGRQSIQVGEAGSYEFEVPIRYGQSNVEFRSYDRYGYFGISRHYINVPRGVIPSGEIEYSSFVGNLSNVEGQYLATNYFKVGLSSRLTVGTELDYYDISSMSQKWHGAITSAARLHNSLIFDGLVSPSSYSQMGLNWQPGSMAEFDIKGIWYARSNPINYGRLNRRWQIASNFPLVPDNLLRMSVLVARNQYDDYREDQLSASLRGLFGKITPEISSRISRRSWDGTTTYPIHSTSFALGAQLPFNVITRTEFSYDHLTHDIIAIRLDVARTIVRRLQAHFAYQRFPIMSHTVVSFDVRYYFPFLDVRATTTRDNSTTTYGLNVIGSMGFDIPGSSVKFNYLPTRQAFGGFTIYPFIDANGNDKPDPGEQTVERGHIFVQNNSAELAPVLLRKNRFSLDRLNPYQSFSIYVDPQSLEDPLIIPKYNSIRFFTEPNYIKDINIPLVYSSTIRGMVVDSDNKPLENISILLKRTIVVVSDTVQYVKRITTFSTGEFEFIMVSPGDYTIEVDPTLIASFGYVSQPIRRRVSVISKPDGDVIGNQDFMLIKR